MQRLIFHSWPFDYCGVGIFQRDCLLMIAEHIEWTLEDSMMSLPAGCLNYSLYCTLNVLSCLMLFCRVTVDTATASFSVGLPMWRFLDFLVTHRFSLFMLLHTFIKFRVCFPLSVSCLPSLFCSTLECDWTGVARFN